MFLSENDTSTTLYFENNIRALRIKIGNRRAQGCTTNKTKTSIYIQLTKLKECIYYKKTKDCQKRTH